jgi:hypothetical protein
LLPLSKEEEEERGKSWLLLVSLPLRPLKWNCCCSALSKGRKEKKERGDDSK